MRSASLIREARLRAGLTQSELAERTDRDRSVIARWEQGGVSPTIDNLMAVVRACGFDLPLVVQGADEITRSIDIVPSTREENLRRLDAALAELGARRPDGSEPSLANS